MNIFSRFKKKKKVALNDYVDAEYKKAEEEKEDLEEDKKEPHKFPISESFMPAPESIVPIKGIKDWVDHEVGETFEYVVNNELVLLEVVRDLYDGLCVGCVFVGKNEECEKMHCMRRDREYDRYICFRKIKTIKTNINKEEN